MKTIQIKVTIDGVNYLSGEIHGFTKKEIEKEIDETLEDKLNLSFELHNGNLIYFGFETLNKSIITIIEL